MPDGPRALQPGEWEQLDHVVSTVFRPTMFVDYPQLFNEPNREHLRVVAEDGRVVTHVGYTQRPASLDGCRVDVACIGAVATLDECRGKGYASLAFQDACDKTAADGVDIMLISGGRGLYTRVGCRAVGRDWDFTLDAAAAERIAATEPAGGALAVAPVGTEDFGVLSALYAAEPVRFIRHAEDWRMALECGVVMNTASDFWAVSTGDTPIAYLIVHQPGKVRRRNPGDPPVVRVVEFAGAHHAVVAAIPHLLRHYNAAQVTLHVQGSDPVLAPMLRAASGVDGAPAATSGTLRVINFVQLMERCRPLLAERLGRETASGLTFHAEAPPGSPDGAFAVRLGGEEARIADLASLAHVLFGNPQRDARPPVTGSPALVEGLIAALPLPSLWYGLSYV